MVGKKKIEVQQDKIDNLIEYSNEIIAIKIDVERMEFDVLRGAENLLKKNKCFIIVETDQNEINVINFLVILDIFFIFLAAPDDIMAPPSINANAP